MSRRGSEVAGERRARAAGAAPARSGDRGRARTPAITFTLVPLLAAAHIAWLRFLSDDAFISFRYAANLVHGHGLVYNPGERVEGYSNFLWTLLAALVLRLNGAPEAVLPWVSAALALATLVAVMRWTLRRGGEPAYAGLLLAASTGFAVWATGGLETALFTALLTGGVLAILSALDAPEPAALLPGALLLALAALTRPEGLLVGACVGAFLLALAVRGELPWRSFAAAAAAWAALVGAHLLWRRATYGHWVPNSFLVKTPGLAMAPHGLGYLLAASRHLALWLLALPVGAALLVRVSRALRARDGALLTMVIAPYAAYVITTGGDFMPAYRFVAPLLPLLALAAGDALDALARRLAARVPRVPPPLWTALVLVPYVALCVRSSADEQHVWMHDDVASVGSQREDSERWERVGLFLAATRDPRDTLATTAAGVIPYRSQLPTIDLLGLNSADLSAYRHRETTMPGHSLYLRGSRLAELQPAVLLGHPIVRSEPRELGVSLDLEPEWQAVIRAPYAQVGFQIPGEPRLYVACLLRRALAERDSAAGIDYLILAVREPPAARDTLAGPGGAGPARPR